MKYIVDRIEGNTVICECPDKSKKTFNISDLYENIKEGDFFEFINGKCIFLKKETDEARKINMKLQQSLFED